MTSHGIHHYFILGVVISLALFFFFVNKDAIFPLIDVIFWQALHFLFLSWCIITKPSDRQPPGSNKAAHLLLNALLDTPTAPFKCCWSRSVLFSPLMFALQAPNSLCLSQNPLWVRIQNKGLWSRYERNILLSRHWKVGYLMDITGAQCIYTSGADTYHCIPRAKTNPITNLSGFAIYAVLLHLL